MRIENDSIRIRDFAESDLPLMLKWLTDDRVLEYYEGRDVRFTMATLAAHFLEEIPKGFRLIIEYENQPVGYGQAYQLSGELFEEYDYPDNGKVVYAMDQFIGEPAYWNRGIGSALLKAMENAFGRSAVYLYVDTENDTAISLYRRAGYEPAGTIPSYYLNGHDAIIMRNEKYRE